LGVAAAIALLKEDYDKWIEGAGSLIPWGKWKPAIDFAKHAIEGLRELLRHAFFDLFALIDMGDKALHGDWAGAKRAWQILKEGAGPAEQKPAGPPGGPYKSGGTAQSKAMAYFQGQGWTKEQAAGLVANFMRESQLNPQAVGDKGAAYGIGQWHPDRQAEFARYFGHSIRGSSLEEQLAFSHLELTRGKERAAGERLRKATSYHEAGSVVSRYYERPAAADYEAAQRGALASRIGEASRGAHIETHIETVNVTSTASDLKGTAKDFTDQVLVSQSNSGLW